MFEESGSDSEWFAVVDVPLTGCWVAVEIVGSEIVSTFEADAVVGALSDMPFEEVGIELYLVVGILAPSIVSGSDWRVEFPVGLYTEFVLVLVGVDGVG